jgi:polyisoprenoid-binding protein YceI
LAASAWYELDPVHTRVLFAVEHAGFSSALGTVSGSSGRLRFDPDDWSTARLEVSVPLQRLDLGDEKWNQAVRAGNLLATARFPTATFVSTRIEPIDPEHASVYGTLTLHGVSKEVKLDVTLNALKRHPLPPFRRTAGFSATATLSRADFGIDAWKSVIGDRVELRLEVEATRTREGGADQATDSDEHDDSEPTPTTEPTTP